VSDLHSGRVTHTDGFFIENFYFLATIVFVTPKPCGTFVSPLSVSISHSTKLSATGDKSDDRRYVYNGFVLLLNTHCKYLLFNCSVG